MCIPVINITTVRSSITCCCSLTCSLRNSISCSSRVLLRSFKDVCLFSAGCADNFSFYKNKKHKECFKLPCCNRRKTLMCHVATKNSLNPSVHTPLQHKVSFNKKPPHILYASVLISHIRYFRTESKNSLGKKISRQVNSVI